MPPRPFPSVMMSGLIPKSLLANISPQRPIPVCTSSAMMTMPRFRQNSSSSLKYPGGGMILPPLAMMGSNMTAAMLPLLAYWMNSSILWTH